MKNKLGVFLAGGLLGAIVALLYAPRTGQETRALVSDKVNAAWGEAQEFGSQAAGNVQRTYQNVANKGQQFAQEAQVKGQAIYDQASDYVKEATGNIKPAFSQKNDELREKIEAARQRIAAQVARNARESQAETGDVTAAAEATSPAPAPAKAEDAAEAGKAQTGTGEITVE